MQFTVIIEKSDNGYAAYLPDLPGCVAAGDTIGETKELIAGAVVSHLEIMAAEGMPIPEPHSSVQVLAVYPIESTYRSHFTELSSSGRESVSV